MSPPARTGQIQRGVIKTNVSEVLPLQEVGLGHNLLETGRTQGKIILKIR